MYLRFNAREHAEKIKAMHGLFEKVVGLNTEESLCCSVHLSITRAGAWLESFRNFLTMRVGAVLIYRVKYMPMCE